MKEFTVYNVRKVAAQIFPMLPEYLREKISARDVAAVLKIEQNYLDDLYDVINFEGPIDLLVNPEHEHEAISFACFLKGLPLNEEDITYILDSEEALHINPSEPAQEKYHFNYN